MKKLLPNVKAFARNSYARTGAVLTVAAFSSPSFAALGEGVNAAVTEGKSDISEMGQLVIGLCVAVMVIGFLRRTAK
ncbi:MAG: major capsid protein [Paraglaciecola chathamensis]